ncbi:MAG: hypothetical protein HY744_12045 [Deltaproteobacteria bacterium]|nr:hypothetical protein [Deltaproteobacteria bacterium]
MSPELEQRRQDAAGRVQAIKASCGALVLAAARGASPASAARIDGALPRALGFTAYVAPGPHVVEVIGPTGAVRRVDLAVQAGESIAIDTSDPAPPPPPPPPPPAPQFVPVVLRPAPEPARFPTLWVALGAGATVLSFALPVALGVDTAARHDAALELGPGHSGYAAALDDYESARTAYEVSFALPAVLGAATAAVAVVGAIRVYAGRRHEVGLAATANAGTVVPWLGGRF